MRMTYFIRRSTKVSFSPPLYSADTGKRRCLQADMPRKALGPGGGVRSKESSNVEVSRDTESHILEVIKSRDSSTAELAQAGIKAVRKVLPDCLPLSRVLRKQHVHADSDQGVHARARACAYLHARARVCTYLCGPLNIPVLGRVPEVYPPAATTSTPHTHSQSSTCPRTP